MQKNLNSRLRLIYFCNRCNALFLTKLFFNSDQAIFHLILIQFLGLTDFECKKVLHFKCIFQFHFSFLFEMNRNFTLGSCWHS